jgi:hypothetical protein
MTPRSNGTLPIAAFLVLIICFVLAQQHDATAKPGAENVIVANSAAQPVPVVPQGITPVTGSVTVDNLPAVQQVAGSVHVSNLPAVQQVVGEVSVATPELRRGRGIIRLTAGEGRMLELPADVVLTDVRLDRASVSGDDAECDVWLFENDGVSFGPVTILRPSAIQRVVEFHLESGFGPTTATVSRGFFMNAACTVSIFWTGYTAG